MPARRLPLIGHLSALVVDPLSALLRWHDDAGDVYRLEMPSGEMWIVNRPEEIEKVLTATGAFIKGRDLRRSKSAFGEGLLTSEGEFWLRQRRLAQPAFRRALIASYAEQMVALTTAFAPAWEPGAVRDVHADMMALTLQIATQTLFADDAVPSDVVGESLEVVLNRFHGAYWLWPDWLRIGIGARYHRAIARLDEVVYAVIARRRAHQEERTDLLSLLLAAADEDGTRMTDRQLRDEVLTMLLAGHETTANALSWSWYLLGEHPEAAKLLHEELDALGREPCARDYPQLRYTAAVITESMRLYPPAWAIGREAVAPFSIAGFEVPKGTQVVMSPWVVHRDARFYGDPSSFRPERWLDGSTREIPGYAYFPFGGGQRMCIGKGFAQMEAVMLLATLARRFRAVPAGPSPKPNPSITLRPGGGLNMRIDAR